MKLAHAIALFFAFLGLEGLALRWLAGHGAQSSLTSAAFVLLLPLACLDLAFALGIALAFPGRRLRRGRRFLWWGIAALVAASIVVPNAVILRRMRAADAERRELASPASGFFEPVPGSIPAPFRETRHEIHRSFASWTYSDPETASRTVRLNQWKSDSDVSCVPGAEMTAVPLRLETRYFDSPVSVRIRDLHDGTEEHELLFSGGDFCLWLTFSGVPKAKLAPAALVGVLKSFRRVP